LKEAEIARLPTDRAQGQLADTMRVPIDSTYLVDRDRTGRYISPAGVAFPASGGPEVPLRPYDEVLILKQPDFELPRTIEVRGEGAVGSPRSVTYAQGQGLDYYLSAAGGVSFRGDSRRVYVQQPNGNVRAVHRRPFPFGTSKPIPEPGAVIVVPVRDTTAQG